MKLADAHQLTHPLEIAIWAATFALYRDEARYDGDGPLSNHVIDDAISWANAAVDDLRRAKERSR